MTMPYTDVVAMRTANGPKDMIAAYKSRTFEFDEIKAKAHR
ncbi:hypothetical protein ACVJGD_008226 [Bradyrhizobium sp. USDA 10063]